MRVWQRVNCGVKVRWLTQALITFANTNSSLTNPNPNLTNSTYPPLHTFCLALESRILLIATPASPHSYTLPNAGNIMYKLPFLYLYL